MALHRSAFRALPSVPTAVMGDVAPMGGLTGGPGSVAPMVVDGRLTCMFMRAGGTRVMGGVTVMDALAMMGCMTVRRGGRGDVVSMRAGRSAASGRMVVTMMRRSGLRLRRDRGVMKVMMMRGGDRWRGAGKGQQQR
jgi:hypothetical protein